MHVGGSAPSGFSHIEHVLAVDMSEATVVSSELQAQTGTFGAQRLKGRKLAGMLDVRASMSASYFVRGCSGREPCFEGHNLVAS